MKDAVVSLIDENELGKIEVVYFYNLNKAINDDVQYKDGKWTFIHDGTSGGYTGNYDRLGEFVRKLKAGRW